MASILDKLKEGNLPQVETVVTIETNSIIKLSVALVAMMLLAFILLKLLK